MIHPLIKSPSIGEPPAADRGSPIRFRKGLVYLKKEPHSSKSTLRPFWYMLINKYAWLIFLAPAVLVLLSIVIFPMLFSLHPEFS